MHSQGICCRGVGGHVGDTQPLREIWLSKTSQYKFERISTHELRRTNLLTLDEEVISATPNVKGEYCHVVEHVNFMINSGKKPLFC